MGNFVLSEILNIREGARTIALPRGRINLHAVPTAAGVETRTGNDYVWNGLKRGNTPFLVLQHTLSGTGALTYENRHHILRAGDTMLVRIPHNHVYKVHQQKEWRFFFIVLAGRELVSLGDQLLGANGPIFRLRATDIDHLAACCAELVERQDLNAGLASALAYRAIMTLYDDVGGAHANEVSWINPVLGFVQSQLHTQIQVQDLADQASLSRAHFVRQFTKQMGQAPADYIFQCRMEKAAELLQDEDVSIHNIAIACGFQNANYFAKAFRRAFDVSPSQFREVGMYTMPNSRRKS